MAELQNEGVERFDDSNIHNRVSEVSHVIKRPHDSNHISRSASEVSLHISFSCSNADKLNPCSRRKSWRRSSRGRRSLPAVQSTSQSLCESISLSLSDNERLEMLMKAAMQRTVKRVKNSLYTIPNVDTEMLQTRVESLHEQWDTVAKEISRETQNSLSSIDSDPVVKEITARVQEDINRLQAENMSWESLLNKHRTTAAELDKCVEQGEETGVPLDQSSFAKSSQSQLIQGKPDYKAVLIRQQKLLRNMELVMDSQCCIMRELLSFHENSQLLLKGDQCQNGFQGWVPEPPFISS